MQLRLCTVPHALRPDGVSVSLGARDAALLAWLALEGPTPRAQLASLLWPESPPTAARNTLRQRLFQLRRSLGMDVVAGGRTLQLAPGVQHDLAAAGSVLADVVLDLGDEYAAWLKHQRDRRQSVQMRITQDEAERCEQAGQFDAALGHAQALLRLAPLSEAAHRRVMRLHYLLGDRAAALLAFDACERMLKDEVGARPSADTLDLLTAVEAAHSPGLPRPNSLPVSLRRPPQMLGREAVLAQLQQAWQHPRHFVLLGEPGMGKTRLLEHLANLWPGALLVRARPGDEAVPLALLARLVEHLCVARPQLRNTPSGRDLLLRLQLQLDTGAVPQRQAPRSLAPAVHVWLAEAGALDLSLLIDDWQFADEASVALITPCLAETGSAVLRLGLAARLHAGPLAERRVQALRQMSGLTCVPLAPLDVAAITDLLSQLQLDLAIPGQAPTIEPTSALALVLQQRVGGNPLHLLELLRHMVHNRLPLQPQHLAVPHQVRELVAERLAQLPAESRQLLQVAAVAGQDFCVALAEAVTGRHALELAEAWVQLEQRGMFGAQGSSHDVFAEVAKAWLPNAIAQNLHERVATWLVTRPHEPGRLAAHWRAAGRAAAALPHLLNAALLAWHAARADETFDFYGQAAQIALAGGDPERAFEIWFDNAEAMSEIGSAAQTAACLQALQPLANSESQALRVRLVRAVLRTAQGEVDAGFSEVGAMLADAIAVGDTRVEAECRFATANRATADGDFDEALQHLAVAERLQHDLGNVRVATALAATKAMVLGLRGQPRLAQREVERTLPLLALHHDRATAIVLRSAQTLQWLRQGQVASALAETRQLMAAAAVDSIGPTDLLIILRNLVDTLRWAGEFSEAQAVGQAFLQRLAPQGDFPSARRSLASLYLHLGRADLALPQIAAAAAVPRMRKREQWQLDLLRIQAALTTGPQGPVTWKSDAILVGDLALAAEWALWSGLQATSPWQAGSLAHLVNRLVDEGLVLLAEPLQALLAGLQGAPPPTASSTALLATTPWTAWFNARNQFQRGDHLAARASAELGVAALQGLATRSVAVEHRDSFAQRHPAHLALQALAARLSSSA